mmetsp:Transcript_22712/g.73549  ORF Transcript_22712/g.73549 Transcript_22712/m.73549 type:complete len:231 (+) Transcript_22712:424-1116(+)
MGRSTTFSAVCCLSSPSRTSTPSSRVSRASAGCSGARQQPWATPRLPSLRSRCSGCSATAASAHTLRRWRRRPSCSTSAPPRLRRTPRHLLTLASREPSRANGRLAARRRCYSRRWRLSSSRRRSRRPGGWSPPCRRCGTTSTRPCARRPRRPRARCGGWVRMRLVAGLAPTCLRVARRPCSCGSASGWTVRRRASARRRARRGASTMTRTSSRSSRRKEDNPSLQRRRA